MEKLLEVIYLLFPTAGEFGILACVNGICPAGFFCNANMYCESFPVCKFIGIRGSFITSIFIGADVATNCASNVALCNNTSYIDLMLQTCPKTCIFCIAGAMLLFSKGN